MKNNHIENKIKIYIGTRLMKNQLTLFILSIP